MLARRSRRRVTAGVQRRLQPLKLVEIVHDGGEKPLRVHVGDGGHLEVDVEIELTCEVGIGPAVAKYAKVEDLLAAAEKPVAILAAVGTQVPDAEVSCLKRKFYTDVRYQIQYRRKESLRSFYTGQ